MQNITISIREDTSAGTSVIQLVAEDRDSDEFGRRTYSITSVSGPSSFLLVNGTFVIPDNSIGTIYTAGNFDRENFEGPYSVMVSDNLQSYAGVEIAFVHRLMYEIMVYLPTMAPPF